MQTLSCEPTPPPIRRASFTFSALRRRRGRSGRDRPESERRRQIILVGCNLGTGHYIDHVANASGHPTYGAQAAFSAADVKTVARVVKGIERSIAFEPMRRALPER
jgi:hypothetical protein